MADSFGKNKGPDGKRPAPTIEGTATEVSVEPQEDVTAAAGGERPDNLDGDEAKPDTSAPPPGPSRFKSFASHLVAGALGGLIGVGALLAWGGLDLGGEKTVAPKLSAMDERLVKLETASTSKSETLAWLNAQIAALESRPQGAPPELAALADRVAAAEAVFQSLPETEQRLNTKIDTALAKTDDAHASTVQALQDQIADLRTRLGGLAEAERSFEAEEFKPEIEALESRVGKLEAAIPNVAAIVSREAEEAKAAALAIAFSNLRAAIGEGRPYDTELDTLKVFSPDVDAGVLAAHTKTGIATLPALAKSFTAAKDIALTQSPPASDGSFLGDLQARAQSLVTIRRLDTPPAGNEPAAVLARAEADLTEGKLADSVKQVETLDGAPRTAFATWLEQVQTRLKAEDELKRLEGRLLVSVGGDVSPGPQSERD